MVGTWVVMGNKNYLRWLCRYMSCHGEDKVLVVIGQVHMLLWGIVNTWSDEVCTQAAMRNTWDDGVDTRSAMRNTKYLEWWDSYMGSYEEYKVPGVDALINPCTKIKNFFQHELDWHRWLLTLKIDKWGK